MSSVHAISAASQNQATSATASKTSVKAEPEKSQSALPQDTVTISPAAKAQQAKAATKAASSPAS